MLEIYLQNCNNKKPKSLNSLAWFSKMGFIESYEERRAIKISSLEGLAIAK